jgi:hypothetical protein
MTNTTFKTVRRALEDYCLNNVVKEGDWISLAIVARDDYHLEFAIGGAGDYVDAVEWSSYEEAVEILENFEDWFDIAWVDFEDGCIANNKYVGPEDIYIRLADYGWDGFQY